jgi:CheY-like chemotaxis protein
MPKKNVFRDFKRHKIMRLIIADDSDVLRSRLVEMLREVKGIDIVGEAKDSEETLAAVNSLRPDVIILDLRMPREEGILALEAIKDIKRKCPIVIIFTNFPYLQYRKSAYFGPYFREKREPYNRTIRHRRSHTRRQEQYRSDNFFFR